LGIKTKLVANPITLHLAQRIVKPSFNITIGVKLFCEGFQFLENFTLRDLDKFHVIVLNTFLDAYKVNIFRKGGKMKVHAKVGFKLVNINVEYNFALVEVGINLVPLANEFELFSFLILIFLKVSQEELKPQGVRKAPAYILDSFNMFLKVLTNELSNGLPPCKKIDHKIRVVPGSALPSKAPYKLNKKELEELLK